MAVGKSMAKRSIRPSFGRRVVLGARAAANSVAQNSTVRRVYAGARGGIAKAQGVAANARARASAILSGSTGKIVAMVVGVAAMVALIPLLKNIFKLDRSPNGGLWLAAIFLGVALVLWRTFGKPSWALAAGGVAGFVLGTEVLDRWFRPAQPQMAAAKTQAQIPDRVPSSPQAQTQRRSIVSGPGSVSKG